MVNYSVRLGRDTSGFVIFAIMIGIYFSRRPIRAGKRHTHPISPSASFSCPSWGVCLWCVPVTVPTPPPPPCPTPTVHAGFCPAQDDCERVRELEDGARRLGQGSLKVWIARSSRVGYPKSGARFIPPSGASCQCLLLGSR